MSRDLFGFDRHLPADGKGEFTDDLVKHRETDDAIHVSADGNETRAKWLPKSLISIVPVGSNERGIKKDGQTVILPVVTITMPQWLAEREGFA
jgi:hypothetical protein